MYVRGVTGSTKERSQRLRDLLETVYNSKPKGLSFPTLRAAAVRAWLISSRTAEEYITVLIDGKLLIHDPPGGPLHITALGEKWLDSGTLDAPTDEAVPILKARKPVQSPLSPDGSGEGERIAREGASGAD